MRKKKTKKQIQEEEIAKIRIAWGAFIIGAFLILGIIAVKHDSCEVHS